MLSRRGLLSAAGLGAATLSGCLTDVGLAETGYLQLKVVDVVWHHRGRRYQDEVLWAVSDGASTLRCRVAERYAGIVDALDDIRVTDELAGELASTFDGTVYAVGFCWAGTEGDRCRNLQAAREAFNRVQFGDRAEVVLRSPEVEVVDVYEGAQRDPDAWETEFRTFDFGALHEAHGAPV